MVPSPRPNVLWLVSEDNRAQFVGAYGDPLARTPHLDRLAAGGIVFTRAYSSAPVCAPAVELSRSRPGGADIRAHALEDPNASVRLAAAGAQLDVDAGHAGAWNVIATALTSDQSTALCLEAAEIATSHREIPPAVLAALRTSAPANDGKAAREPGPASTCISRLVRSWESPTTVAR